MNDDNVERKLTTILSADVVGYSSKMSRDEVSTLNTLKQIRRTLVEPKSSQYGGKSIKLMGDGELMEFASVVDALMFAIEVQSVMADRNSDLPEAEHFQFRIGINVGDIMVDGNDIYGDGVNIAARLEALAEPGGVCVSRVVVDHIGDKLDVGFDDLGEHQVKNIPQPISVASVRFDERTRELVTPIPAETAPVRSAFQRYIALSVLTVALLAAGFWGWYSQVDSSVKGDPSIAVLPLDDLSTGEHVGYLSDALSEGIIAELARFPQFKVVARNSSFQFRDKAKDIREIGETLGVHYVLEGSQQFDGESLRVTIQLIEAQSGTHIFADKIDGKVEDLFEVQDRIVRKVATVVGEKVINHVPTARSENEVSSLLRTLKARSIATSGWNRANWEKALELEQTSVRLDPESPWGHIGSAIMLRNGAESGWTDGSREETLREAMEYANKALDLAPNNHVAHYAMARVLTSQFKYDEAVVHLQRAAELNSSDPVVRFGMATLLMYTGRSDQALEILLEIKSIDPMNSTRLYGNLGWAYWQNRDCDKGIEATLSVPSKVPWVYKQLAGLYACAGKIDESQSAMSKYLELRPKDSLAKERASGEKKWTDRSILETMLSDLKLAGMPE